MSNIYTAQELKERIESNDNRGTAMPYLLFLQERRELVAANDYGDSYKWVENITGDFCTFNTKEEAKAFLRNDYLDDDECEFDGNDIQKYAYHEIWETQNVFLTDKGYQDHLKENSHNLKEHRTYGTHAFRNKEIRSLYALIGKVISLEEEKKELVGALEYIASAQNKPCQSDGCTCVYNVAQIALNKIKKEEAGRGNE